MDKHKRVWLLISLLLFPGFMVQRPADEDNPFVGMNFRNATNTGQFDIISQDWPHQGNHCSEKALIPLTPHANGRNRFIVAGVSFSATESVVIVEKFDGIQYTGMISPLYDRVFTAYNSKIENVRIASLGGEEFVIVWTQHTVNGPRLYELAFTGGSYKQFDSNLTIPKDVSGWTSLVLFGDVAVNPLTGEPGFTWTQGTNVHHRFIRKNTNGTVYCLGTCDPILNVYGLANLHQAQIEYGSGGRPHVAASGQSHWGNNEPFVIRTWYKGGSPGWGGSFGTVDQLPIASTALFAIEMVGANIFAVSEDHFYNNEWIDFVSFTRQHSNGFTGMNPNVPSERLGTKAKFPGLATDSDGRPYSSLYNLNNSELEVLRWNWNGWGYAAGQPAKVTFDGLTKWWSSLRCDTRKRPTLAYTICNSASPTCADSEVRYTALQ